MTDQPTERRKLPYDAYTECWYVPGETAVVDLIHPDDGLTLHFQECAAEIQARHPAAQRMAFDEAWKLADAAGTERCKQDITEVTEARFMDALNVLPPVGWTTRQGVESFRIPERLWGSLTDIYARLGDRYFKLVDDIRLPAATIAEQVTAYARANPAPVSSARADDVPARDADSDRRLNDRSASRSEQKPGGSS